MATETQEFIDRVAYERQPNGSVLRRKRRYRLLPAKDEVLETIEPREDERCG